jgi:ribosomal protein S18 acetylase RimI-like enzyme
MRVLYRALISAEEAEVLVADDGAGVVGFVAGVTNTQRFYRRFALRHGLAALLASLPRLLAPRLLRRALETLGYGSGGGGRGVEAELLAMAVLPSIRGRGVGTELGRRFLEALASRGVSPVKVVVGAGNEPALALYRSLGFTDQIPIEVHSGEASVELLWSA